MNENKLKTLTLRDIQERARKARRQLADIPPATSWSESLSIQHKVRQMEESMKALSRDIAKINEAKDRLTEEALRQAMRRGLAIDAAMEMGVPVDRQALMPCADVEYINVGGVRWRYGRDRGGTPVAVPDSLP